MDAATEITVRWSFDANTRYESGRIILMNDDTDTTLVDVDFGSKTATVKVKKGTPADQVVAVVSGQFTAKLKT